MKIFMPTANRYVWFAETSARLLHKYWPDHPPVDVVHFEARPAIDLPGFRLLDFGREAAGGTWAAQFTRYLRECNGDELLLLTLDDYGLFQPPDAQRIAAACDVLRADRNVLGVALTWQPIGKLPYKGRDDVIVFPAWTYSINTQAGIWRREELLRLIETVAPTGSPWNFEVPISRHFNTVLYPQGFRIAGVHCPEPSHPSDFVDSVDKRGWAYAYHNLCHQRQRDPRHDAFLRAEGLLP